MVLSTKYLIHCPSHPHTHQKHNRDNIHRKGKMMNASVNCRDSGMALGRFVNPVTRLKVCEKHIIHVTLEDGQYIGIWLRQLFCALPLSAHPSLAFAYSQYKWHEYLTIFFVSANLNWRAVAILLVCGWLDWDSSGCRRHDIQGNQLKGRDGTGWGSLLELGQMLIQSHCLLSTQKCIYTWLAGWVSLALDVSGCKYEILD